MIVVVVVVVGGGGGGGTFGSSLMSLHADLDCDHRARCPHGNWLLRDI